MRRDYIAFIRGIQRANSAARAALLACRACIVLLTRENACTPNSTYQPATATIVIPSYKLWRRSTSRFKTRIGSTEDPAYPVVRIACKPPLKRPRHWKANPRHPVPGPGYSLRLISDLCCDRIEHQRESLFPF